MCPNSIDTTEVGPRYHNNHRVLVGRGWGMKHCYIKHSHKTITAKLDGCCTLILKWVVCCLIASASFGAFVAFVAWRGLPNRTPILSKVTTDVNIYYVLRSMAVRVCRPGVNQNCFLKERKLPVGPDRRVGGSNTLQK